MQHTEHGPNLGLRLGLIWKRLPTDLSRHGEIIFEIITSHDNIPRRRYRQRCEKEDKDQRPRGDFQIRLSGIVRLLVGLRFDLNIRSRIFDFPIKFVTGFFKLT